MSEGGLMHYVYILKSETITGHFYAGETGDLRQRLSQHNAGKSSHTAKYVPWKLIWYCAFPSREAALRFEIYLKTASGRAFQKKHFGAV
jgi:predicted GIY-YIG superfamily endonuclease